MMYVPNLIDYLRYALSIKSMHYAFNESQWGYFIAYYYAAIFMDIVDGFVARLLDQESKFGAVLDMVCDRMSVSMMYFVLARVWPQYETFLIAFFIIDYGGHFLQVTANALTKNSSHKNMDIEENPLVRLYYTNKVFFITMACGADNGLVLAFLYGRYTVLQEILFIKVLVHITTTIICLKQVINIGQCIGAIKKIQKYDLEKKRAAINQPKSNTSIYA